MFALWDTLVKSIVWKTLLLANEWAALGHMEHFEGYKSKCIGLELHFCDWNPRRTDLSYYEGEARVPFWRPEIP